MQKKKIYFLKTKGTSKIPDYIQVRDEDFVLISHITLKGIQKGLDKLSDYSFPDNFVEVLMDIPEGVLQRFEF